MLRIALIACASSALLSLAPPALAALAEPVKPACADRQAQGMNAAERAVPEREFMYYLGVYEGIYEGVLFSSDDLALFLERVRKNPALAEALLKAKRSGVRIIPASFFKRTTTAAWIDIKQPDGELIKFISSSEE